MVNVSIFTLIYKSVQYADFMYKQIYQFTPMIAKGKAEFYFVANDPTDELIRHLYDKKYPHITVINPHHTDEELFSMGIGCPEYMNRVYKGYNEGIRAARGEIVVLLNSDQCLSYDWLENLLKYLAPGTCISSMLIERPEYKPFPGQYSGSYGNHPSRLDMRYLDEIKRLKVTGLVSGRAYMPLALYKEDAIRVGLYPEGNIAGRTFNDVPEQCGDECFISKLRDIGVLHFTSLDSIVYHIKEGERDE